MRYVPEVCLVLALPLSQSHAQNEAALRRAFEGQSVVLRIAMPGTSSGVNVYPGQEMPIDFPDLASKLKKYGTALRTGDAVMITRIKVKDDLIEFQLGGGSYGTFGDNLGESSNATEVGETPAEKALRDAGTATAAPVEAAAATGAGSIRKGLMLDQVERLLGPAITAAESDECSLKVMTRTYRKDGQQTRFGSGVLVEYTILPE
jgi:hypothetical protein